MWRVSGDLEQAFRSGVTGTVVCDVYRGTQKVAVLANADRTEDGFGIVSGGVSMTDEPGVRATLNMDIVPAPGLWDLFAPYGITLRPRLVFRWGIDTESVPLGWFDVQEQSLSYEPGGLLSFSGCPDLWSRVQDNRLDRPVTPTGNAVALAAQYARAALGSQVTAQDVQASTARVAGQVYEDSRDEAVQALLRAAGRIAYVSRDGRLVVRRPYTLSGPPVWDVDPFHGGVLISADRTRSARPVRNRVVVIPSGTATFPRVYVDDTDPNSPTRVTGPMGVRQRFYSSPSIRTAEQARVAGRDVLRRSTGLGADLSLTVVPHWGLEPGDLISVALPGIGGDGYAAENHLIASVDLPFPQRGSAVTQSITTRSTRPDGGEDIDEEAL